MPSRFGLTASARTPGPPLAVGPIFLFNWSAEAKLTHPKGSSGDERRVPTVGPSVDTDNQLEDGLIQYPRTPEDYAANGYTLDRKINRKRVLVEHGTRSNSYTYDGSGNQDQLIAGDIDNDYASGWYSDYNDPPSLTADGGKEWFWVFKFEQLPTPDAYYPLVGDYWDYGFGMVVWWDGTTPKLGLYAFVYDNPQSTPHADSEVQGVLLKTDYEISTDQIHGYTMRFGNGVDDTYLCVDDSGPLPWAGYTLRNGTSGSGVPSWWNDSDIANYTGYTAGGPIDADMSSLTFGGEWDYNHHYFPEMTPGQLGTYDDHYHSLWRNQVPSAAPRGYEALAGVFPLMTDEERAANVAHYLAPYFPVTSDQTVAEPTYPSAPPIMPSNFIVTATGPPLTITLTWDPQGDAEGFIVTPYSYDIGQWLDPIDVGLVYEWVDPSPNEASNFYYQLSAYNTLGGNGAAAYASTSASPPNYPYPVTITYDDTTFQPVIHFAPYPFGGPAVTQGFRIKRAIGPSYASPVVVADTNVLDPSATSWTDNTVVEGQSYEYWVYAVGDFGASDAPYPVIGYFTTATTFDPNDYGSVHEWWDPADLSSLTLVPDLTGAASSLPVASPADWFDGADGTTLHTSSGSVVSVDNKGSSGRNWTASGSITVGSQNGHSVLAFDSNDAALTMGGSGSSLAQPVTIFAVYRTNAYAVSKFASRTRDGSLGFGYDPNGGFVPWSCGFVGGGWNTPVLRAGGAHVVATRLNSSSAGSTEFRINGATELKSDGLGSVACTDDRWDLGPFGGTGWQAEFIVYHQALSDAEIDAVERYLMAKWGCGQRVQAWAGQKGVGIFTAGQVNSVAWASGTTPATAVPPLFLPDFFGNGLPLIGSSELYWGMNGQQVSYMVTDSLPDAGIHEFGVLSIQTNDLLTPYQDFFDFGSFGLGHRDYFSHRATVSDRTDRNNLFAIGWASPEVTDGKPDCVFVTVRDNVSPTPFELRNAQAWASGSQINDGTGHADPTTAGVAWLFAGPGADSVDSFGVGPLVVWSSISDGNGTIASIAAMRAWRIS